MARPESRTPAARLAGRMQLLTRMLMAATPIVFGLVIALRGVLTLLPIPGGILVDLSGQSVPGLFVITMLAALKPAVFFIGLWLLHDLFHLCGRGRVFDADGIRRIGQLGWVLIGIDLADFIQRLAVGPLLTMLEASEPFLSVGIGLSLSIIGAFVVVIARLMMLTRQGRGTA
ncbi:MAG: DUF2975 domain-containing protein [Pseudomonadota bacterium]